MGGLEAEGGREGGSCGGVILSSGLRRELSGRQGGGIRTQRTKPPPWGGSKPAGLGVLGMTNGPSASGLSSLAETL